MKSWMWFAFEFMASLAYGQPLVSSDHFLEHGVMSTDPGDLFHHPGLLLNCWNTHPVPISYYSPEDLSHQQEINKQAHGVITYQPKESTEILGEWEQEDITPYTWKWVHFEINDSLGPSSISLRRPNWWIEKVGAQYSGVQVFLAVPELGIRGQAKVTHLSTSLIDTRIWDDHRTGEYVFRPVTGKIAHFSNAVYDLYVLGQGKSIGVTENHPFWSIERNGWVPVHQLHIGEVIKTWLGETVITALEKRSGTHRVYNLEVYRDHNYLVSGLSILVHNSCIEKFNVSTYIKKIHNPALKKIKPGQSYVNPDKVQEYVDIMKKDDFKWSDVIKKDSDKIRIVHFEDRDVIYDGHHKFVAAQASGVPIDLADRRIVQHHHWEGKAPKGDIIEWEDVKYQKPK